MEVIQDSERDWQEGETETMGPWVGRLEGLPPPLCSGHLRHVAAAVGQGVRAVHGLARPSDARGLWSDQSQHLISMSLVPRALDLTA